MPKIQLDLPQDVYDTLKHDAKERYQSLRAHITYRLVQMMRNPRAILKYF